MARQLLTATAASRAGVVLTTYNVLAADGAKVAFSSEPRLVFLLDNSAGDDPSVVTFEIPTLVDGIAVVNGGKQITVTDGTKKYSSLYPSANYKQSDNMIYINATENITVGVLSVGPAA